MKKGSNFNKKQEKVALQWATVVNAFISFLILLGKFTVPLLYGGQQGVVGVGE